MSAVTCLTSVCPPLEIQRSGKAEEVSVSWFLCTAGKAVALFTKCSLLTAAHYKKLDSHFCEQQQVFCVKVKAHTQYIEDGDYIICIVGAPDKSPYRMMSSNSWPCREVCSETVREVFRGHRLLCCQIFVIVGLKDFIHFRRKWLRSKQCRHSYNFQLPPAFGQYETVGSRAVPPVPVYLKW